MVSQSTSEAPTGTVPTILEAIVRKLCLSVVYNRQRAILAPHILYTRHGDLHVDGVVLERDSQAPRELKIGTYRLSGLSDIALTDRPFFVIEGFDPAAERYQGETLLAVDRL